MKKRGDELMEDAEVSAVVRQILRALDVTYRVTGRRSNEFHMGDQVAERFAACWRRHKLAPEWRINETFKAGRWYWGKVGGVHLWSETGWTASA